MASGGAPADDFLTEQVREIQVQVIDRSLQAAFLKTVHRIPVLPGGGLSVVRKRRYPPEAMRGVVVLVHGFGQNRYAWHTPRRSFANYLAFRGYDVFNLELRGFGRSGQFGSPLPDHPDVHFEVDVPHALEAVRAISGTERVFLVGHSLGGACCYAAAPLVAEWVRGVVTIAGLYRFAPVPGLLALASALTTRVERSAGRPSSVRLPVDRIGQVLRALQGVMNSRLYRRVPAQTWFPGTIEADVLSFLNERAYEPASLGVALAIAWWGRLGRVTDRSGRDLLSAFDALDVPLLVLAGSHDLLMPPSGAKAAFSASKSRDKTFRVLGPKEGGHHWGHVDLIMGDDAPAYLWTTVSDWLDAH